MDRGEACAFVEARCSAVVAHHGEVHVPGTLTKRLVAQFVKNCVADSLAAMCATGGHALDSGPTTLDHDLPHANDVRVATGRCECCRQAGSQKRVTTNNCVSFTPAST